MLESVNTQTIATRSPAGKEIITKLEPAYLATISRLSKTVQTQPFVKNLPPNIGGTFNLTLPDNMPEGSIVVVYWFDQTGHAASESYMVRPRIEGKIVVEQTQLSTDVKTYVGNAVTGESLKKFDQPTTLTPIGVGDDISKSLPDTTPFRSLNIVKSRPGQDYYRVAIATPNSLRRI